MSAGSVTRQFKVWDARKESILLSLDGTYSNADWYPIKPLQIKNCLNRGHRGFAMVTVPKWLAKEKGLMVRDSGADGTT